MWALAAPSSTQSVTSAVNQPRLVHSDERWHVLPNIRLISIMPMNWIGSGTAKSQAICEKATPPAQLQLRRGRSCYEARRPAPYRAGMLRGVLECLQASCSSPLLRVTPACCATQAQPGGLGGSLSRGRLRFCPACAAAAQPSVAQRPVEKQRLLFATVEALFSFPPFFALAARQVPLALLTRHLHEASVSVVCNKLCTLTVLSRCAVAAGKGEDCAGEAAGAHGPLACLAASQALRALTASPGLAIDR